MEELTTILEERRKSISELSLKGEDRPKFQLIEEQRKRNERQNWILRILKSLKVFSAQQKRIIHETVIKVMNYHNKMQTTPIDFQSSNFLEVMINLFVEFFNKFEKMDYTQVKSIIRPNNNFIIVDLLKELIQLGRKEFKIAVQNHYKQEAIPRVDKKLSIRSLIKLPPLQQSGHNNRLSSKRSKREYKIPLETKIKYSLMEKYKRCIDNFNPDYAYEKINEVYFDLLYLNQRNSSRIQKYMDSCYGAKRHINYNASGLYTQQEIKRMLKVQEEKALIREAEMKQLSGECSAQQLKEYFKMQVQMHQSKGFLPVSAKPQRIRQWFPICLIKNGDKLHPYNILVQTNNNTFSIREYEQKFNKKIKVYMKELLQQMKGGQDESQILLSTDFIKFNRKQILDYNNNKILELIMKQPPIITKKDGLLPIINNYSQQDQQQFGRKAKSETKLPHKSLIIPNLKLKRTIDKQIQTRLNYSSIVKEINVGSKRKIDTLIDQIIKTRQKAK